MKPISSDYPSGQTEIIMAKKNKNRDAICAAQLQQSTINEAQQRLNKAIPLQ